jgi:hypothetical protein
MDFIGSGLAVILKFSYASLLPVSILVYFLTSYRAAKYFNIGGTIAYGAFLGAVDGTIGWKISTWLGADPRGSFSNVSFAVWCITVCLVMTFDVLISLLGRPPLFLVTVLCSSISCSSYFFESIHPHYQFPMLFLKDSAALPILKFQHIAELIQTQGVSTSF